VGEILIVAGNLVYTLGASVAGYKGKGPGIHQEIEKQHREKETPGTALMLVGLDIASWFSDWERIQTTDSLRKSEE
jgi:hypothetical protein